MSGANCYWALLRHDGSGTLETAASLAASAPAALVADGSVLSPSEDEDRGAFSASQSLSPHLFRLFDAALRGFLTSACCLTRDSERYSVEARSLASSGSLEQAFLFLGRALEVRFFFLVFFFFFFSLLLSRLCSFSRPPFSFHLVTLPQAAAISKAMSELEASRAARNGTLSSASSASAYCASAATAAAAAAAAASVSATTVAFSAHLSRCVEATRALAVVRRSAPAAYAVLSRVMTARAAAPPPPVPLFAAVGRGAASAALAGAAAPPPRPERPQRPPALTDALRDRLKALAAGAGCLPTWPPRGASSALLC